MDYNKINEAAKAYEADMTRFLRDLVKFPGESCGEKRPHHENQRRNGKSRF